MMTDAGYIQMSLSAPNEQALKIEPQLMQGAWKQEQ